MSQNAETPDQAGPNFREIAYWNSETAGNWVAAQERMDTTLAPIAAATLARAAPEAGERAIDVGCGCGATVLALAEAVGLQGQVLGIDVSEAMLARARERTAGLRQVRLEQADASQFPFPAAAADLVFSRFGVMFFRNPVDAFANLRRATRPDGRLVFAAWRTLDENPFFTVALRAALAFVPPPPRPPPDEPGPFAFAGEQRVRAILERAGWSQVTHDPCDLMLRAAAPGGVAELAARAVRMGPAARALSEAPDAVREQARAAIARALAEHEGPEGVTLKAAIWLVSARA